MASVFSPAYKVPDNLIAETPALRKKTNSIQEDDEGDRKTEVRDEKQADLHGPAVEPPPSGAGADGAGSVAVSCTSSRSSRNAVGRRGTRCSPFAMAAAD